MVLEFAYADFFPFKAAIKIFNSDWSERFSLDAVGSSGTIVAKSKDGRSYLVRKNCLLVSTLWLQSFKVQMLLFFFSFQLSVGITLSATGLTRIVTFTPYYFILNNCKVCINCPCMVGMGTSSEKHSVGPRCRRSS